jgi:hypothetical protein
MNTPTKQTVYLPKSTFPLSMKGKVDDLFCLQQGYFFTPEQLNEYTANVIKQALDTAAETKVKGVYSNESFSRYDCDKQSITNTFEETYKKFEV